MPDPKTLEERQKVAREFASQFRFPLPILVDTLDDHVEKAYAGWPDRLYVIDAEGKIAYKGGPGPGGFRVAEIPPVLDRLLAGQPAPAPVAPEMRQRLAMMLGRLGFTEAESRAVIRTAEQKAAAYREFAQARVGLFDSARRAADAAKALAAYDAALARYEETVRRLDRDLDAATGYTKNPERQALLTAIGLIGITPAPPASRGMQMEASPRRLR